MPDIYCTMDKLNGLAALLYTENLAPKTFGADDRNGIAGILRDSARDLEQINDEHTQELDLKSDRERRLERFMRDMVTQMEEADNWDLKAAADNIRHELSGSRDLIPSHYQGFYSSQFQGNLPAPHLVLSI